MRIYLDTCALQRPLDSKTQVWIALEAEAVLCILALCEAGQVELVSSEALEFETACNTNIARQEYAFEILARAKEVLVLSDSIEERAREFHASGMKPLDALHLAFAEESGVDFFCTCDDQFLNKAKSIESPRIKVAAPIELIEEIGKMTIEAKPLADITREAIRVLAKEIGIVNTLRFINQFTTGYGDYTEEREQLFAEMTLDDVLSAIRKKRNLPSG
jgi:predicted nucleic acid-binding protein